MADLSDAPEDVVAYYRKIQEGYDCVFGSRFIKGSVVQQLPAVKLVVNRIVNRCIQLMFWTRFNDLTNAFKAYRTEVIRDCGPYRASHFNLTLEMSLGALIRELQHRPDPDRVVRPDLGQLNLQLGEMGRRYLSTLLMMFFQRYLIADDLIAERLASRSERLPLLRRPRSSHPRRRATPGHGRAGQGLRHRGGRRAGRGARLPLAGRPGPADPRRHDRAGPRRWPGPEREWRPLTMCRRSIERHPDRGLRRPPASRDGESMTKSWIISLAEHVNRWAEGQVAGGFPFARIALWGLFVAFVLTTLPNYPRLYDEAWDKEQASWSALIEKRDDLFKDMLKTHPPGSHDAKMTFRIAVPAIARLLGLGKLGIYAFQSICGVVLLWVVGRIDKVSGDLVSCSI